MTVRTLIRLTLVLCVLVTAAAVMRSRSHEALRHSAIAALKGPSIAAVPLPALRRVATATASASSVRPVFGFRVADDGARQVYFERPELRFEKTVHLDGHTTTIIEADDDRVELAVSPAAGIVVSRGGRSMTVVPSNEADVEGTRALLAGSKAVQRFRTLAGYLETSQHRMVTAVQITDAIVGLLDGDSGAPIRFGRRVEARRSALVRRVKMEESSCWSTYEQGVSQAWEEYKQCAESFSIFNPLSAGCAAEWVVRVEGDWAEYLACSSIKDIVGDIEAEG
jgi:hypothetical protein